MTKVYAHRGFDARYAENTLDAFLSAAALGCDGIEVDARLTRDGIAVLFHDARLERLTDGSGLVKAHTLSEIMRLNIRQGVDNGAARQKIITLHEYLQWAKGVPLTTNIEIKRTIGERSGIEDAVLETVARNGMEDHVMYSSFHPLSLSRVRALSPHARCALLTKAFVKTSGALAGRMRMDALHPPLERLTNQAMCVLRARGLACAVWGADTPQDIARAIGLGVDAIITNRPDIALQMIREKGENGG